MTLRDLSWTCHFCGERRPDDQVGVVSRQTAVVGVSMQENRRFCRDREACREAAERWRRGEREPDPPAR